MPTLEELLRVSLKGANERFDQANKTLHAVVVEAAKAVEAATEGKATVRLHVIESNESGTRYSLQVCDRKGTDTRFLTDFNVTKNGFPIFEGSNRNAIGSAEAFTSYFQKLMSDPESPLVGYLAYIVRNSATTDAIPF